MIYLGNYSYYNFLIKFDQKYSKFPNLLIYSILKRMEMYSINFSLKIFVNLKGFDTIK